MPIELKLEKFAGPLALLLKLVEDSKLEITDVALAQVTEIYLKCLEKAQLAEEEMADFLIMAARLLLLKSRALLPVVGPDDEEGLSLQDQLRMYKEYVEATKKVEEMIKKKRFAFFRAAPLKPLEAGFYPPRSLNIEKMKIMFTEALARLRPIVELPKAALEKAMTIKEKIAYIQNLLSFSSRVGFKHLLSFAKNRTEIIVSFLALLELTKQQDVAISQDNNFGDIMIEKI